MSRGQMLKVGDFILKLEEEDIDGEFTEKAEQELRETPANRLAALEALRELIKGDTELNFPHEDDSRLLIFLRPCKFYPESAFELVKRYYNFKLKNPKFYYDLKPSREKNLFDQNLLTVLPKRDQHGQRVMVLEAGARWKPSKCKLEEVFRGCALFLEAAMGEPKTQVSGVVVIIDQSGLSLTHVMQFTPSFARAVVSWVQESLPIRLKAIHIINQPYIFNMVFAIFKPFLTEKLRKRIHFHGEDRESLMQHVDSLCLPTKYGGKLDIPDITGQQWYDLLVQSEDVFEVLNQYGYAPKKKSKK